MKRIAVPLAAAASMALLLSSCSTAAESADGEDITINVWSWQKPFSDSWDKIFALYEEANPGVDIVFTGYEGTEYPTVLNTGLSGSDGPDIVMLHPYTSMEPYVAAGQLEPIDGDMIAGLEDSFSPESLAASNIDGVQYGVPFAVQTVQVYYNIDIFEEVGVEVPTSPADVKPMLDAIADAGYTPISVTGADAWQLVNVFDALVGPSYGGREWVDGVLNGTAAASDDEFVGALEEFASLAPYFPEFVTGVNYTDSQALFSSGEAAMYPGGAWELAGFQAANPDLNIGVFSMPAADGSTPTWGYEDGSLALSARASERDAAIDLLNWMATQEFGEAFTNELKQVSSVKGVEVSDPILSAMIANYQANPVPMVWVTDYFGVSSPAPYAALMNGAQEILLGTKTPKQVGTSIDESIALFTAQ